MDKGGCHLYPASMCASYVIKAKRDQLRKRYGVDLPDDIEGIDERVVPYKLAPVIVASGGKLKLEPMQFSLVPSWSKERKPKFATFNARIEEIDIKPTWKDSFKNQHCIVPLTNFIEPIYTGEFAGHMVSFNGTEILSAAGVYSSWTDRITGDVVESFAIIMTDALPFVAKTGHERSPVFLNEEREKKWLLDLNMSPRMMKEFLLSNREIPELTVTSDRFMAKGWEKRIPTAT